MNVEDMDPTVPVEITHPSGVSFHINLTKAEINRFQTDVEYATSMTNKYYTLYQDGIVTGFDDSNEELVASVLEEETQSNNQQDITFEEEEDRVVELSALIREWNSDDEETLIRLVSERPPLFNFRLPVGERSREISRRLWAEILRELNVNLTVDQIIKKWKNIRDSYMRARTNINKKLASGSSPAEKLAGERLRRKHKNYELLLFLDDSLTQRRTSSNLDETEEAVQPVNEIVSPRSMPSTSSSSRRPSVLQEQTTTLTGKDRAFLDAVKNLPGPKDLTPTQNYCLRLADGMDKLPLQIRNQLQVEFLQRITEMENKYVYN